MQIHAISTGTVRLKDAFLVARSGPMRQPRLFLPGPFSEPMPIHVWVVEHEGRRLLVDTGETADVRDIPFAHFQVSRGDELPAMLATIGLTVEDIDEVVLTHLHGDHVDGAVHLHRPVLAHGPEVAFAHSAMSRIFQKVLRQPLPEGIDYRSFQLDGGPFGAFASSRALSEDGRILAVATPGHTPGHISVLCIDDEGRHVLLAGDATDSLEQLHARRPDAIAPKPNVYVQTIDRILAHGRYLLLMILPPPRPAHAPRLRPDATLFVG
jgi:glyoxylase-like metal-dependent hydrolase (beta-lactamase superfamily II)